MAADSHSLCKSRLKGSKPLRVRAEYTETKALTASEALTVDKTRQVQGGALTQHTAQHKDTLSESLSEFIIL